MDEETKASMSLPRCGLPDIQRKGRHGRRGGGYKWPKKTLTFSVLRYSRQMSTTDVG